MESDLVPMWGVWAAVMITEKDFVRGCGDSARTGNTGLVETDGGHCLVNERLSNVPATRWWKSTRRLSAVFTSRNRGLEWLDGSHRREVER